MNRPETPSFQSFEDWRRTHPPMMGGDPNLPESVGEEMAAIADVSTEAAPEQGTSGEQAGADLGQNFRLEDVDEAYRSDVERYMRQVQGAYTRKTQELAAQRRELEPIQSLHQRLQDDTQRDAALRELLAQNGWEVDGDDEHDEDVYDDDFDTEDEQYGDEPTTELAQRLAQLEAAEEARHQAAFEAQVKTHVESALEAYRAEEGLDTVPDAVKAGIAAQLHGLDQDDNGLPNITGAIALYREQQAAAVQAYLASKRGADMDLSGVSSPQPAFNPRDVSERRARADAIAGRHL